MSDRKFKLSTSGKERTGDEVMWKEPGLANVIPNNCGEEKLGRIAPQVVSDIIERGDRPALDRLLTKDWEGCAMRLSAFAKMLAAADAKLPKAEPAKEAVKAK